jgi:two-component system nitrogen regulation sensor histidine kinase GlnL
MNKTAAKPTRHDAFSPTAALGAMPFTVVVIDADDRVLYINGAAEQFFANSAAVIRGRPLTDLVFEDNPIFSLIRQVRAAEASVTEYDVSMSLPNRGTRTLTIAAAPFAEGEGTIVLSLHEQSIARKIDQQLVHRNAARSVSTLGAMLAHEVKNPLSGIKGAAQLLEQTASEDDRQLTRLICEESDRICALVDRMGVFADAPPLDRKPINIHEVMERVRLVAETGFASGIRFVELYDPSLPEVMGDRDQLIQLFLNLVKNAADAAPKVGGEIVLSSSYQHGIRIAVPGSAKRIQLPIVVSVRDNGPGVPQDVAAHLFEPFTTTKPQGSGLGLALVAKIVGEHGGVIEFESEPGQTVFRVMLPASGQDAA